MNAFGPELGHNVVERTGMLFFKWAARTIKFVKIATEDCEKFYALKKRNGRVFGFLPNATFEFKP
jgi:hypothetical protein